MIVATVSIRTPSVDFHDVFAAVLGVADEALASRVDDPVEQFERNLADQDGELIADLADVDRTISSLDGQTHRAKHWHRERASPSPRRLTHP